MEVPCSTLQFFHYRNEMLERNNSNHDPIDHRHFANTIVSRRETRSLHLRKRNFPTNFHESHDRLLDSDAPTVDTSYFPVRDTRI